MFNVVLECASLSWMGLSFSISWLLFFTHHFQSDRWDFHPNPLSALSTYHVWRHTLNVLAIPHMPLHNWNNLGAHNAQVVQLKSSQATLCHWRPMLGSSEGAMWGCTGTVQLRCDLGGTAIMHNVMMPRQQLFAHTMWQGTCDAGQLTPGGLRDMCCPPVPSLIHWACTHTLYLGPMDLYHDHLGLIGKEPQVDQVWVCTACRQRTVWCKSQVPCLARWVWEFGHGLWSCNCHSCVPSVSSHCVPRKLILPTDWLTNASMDGAPERECTTQGTPQCCVHHCRAQCVG